MNAITGEIFENARKGVRVSTATIALTKSANKTCTSLNENSVLLDQTSKLINSIGEQTCLLAKNAMIEAVRVGDAGKGFTLIAREIMDLANATSLGMKDVTNYIINIQRDTKNCLEALNDISRTTQEINDISAQIADAIDLEIKTNILKLDVETKSSYKEKNRTDPG